MVADIGADLDGRVESGSLDLEERNALARAIAATRATILVVVGGWSTTGVHRLVRTLLDLDAGTASPGDRLRPVLNHGPRRRSGQALAQRTVQRLLEDVAEGPWPTPTCLAHDPGVERTVREATALPPRFVRRVGRILEGTS